MAWYFLRVPRCRTKGAVESFRQEIARLGRVRECGLGTEVDPTAGWYTVSAREKEVPEVRERLRDLGISEHVDLVEPLRRPIEGRSMARQLGLF